MTFSTVAARVTFQPDEAVGQQALAPHVLLGAGEDPLDFHSSLAFAYEGQLDEAQYQDTLGYADDMYDNMDDKQGLEREEFYSMHYYTAEWFPKQSSVYSCLNRDLSDRDRTKAQKWRFFLHHFFGGMRKVPLWKGSQDLYRGVSVDLSKNPRYKEGKTITWSACTSATTKQDVVKGFLPAGEERTIVTMNGVFSGRSVKAFSATGGEEEVLLPPGTRFRVIAIWHINEVTMLQLQQIPTLEKRLALEPVCFCSMSPVGETQPV